VKIAEVDRDEWAVEMIVDHKLEKSGKRKKKNDYSFRVRWMGFDATEDTWLPYADVRDLAALDVYLQSHPGLGL
jgi:hypothetical protein